MLAGIGATSGLAKTKVLLCTEQILLWTDSSFESGDGLVTEEVVTAGLIQFTDILGAQVRKKGRVDIWMRTDRTSPSVPRLARPPEAAPKRRAGVHGVNVSRLRAAKRLIAPDYLAFNGAAARRVGGNPGERYVQHPRRRRRPRPT